jgi:hypothetical protein
MRRLPFAVVLIPLVLISVAWAGDSTQTTAGGTWLKAFGTSQDDSLAVLRQTGDGGYVFGGGTGSLSGDTLDLDSDGLLFKSQRQWLRGVGQALPRLHHRHRAHV